MASQSERNQTVIEEFHTNGGKVGGHFAGRTLLILHTVGARSGREHVVPVAYVRNGDDYVVIASKGGAPTHPDWYYNLLSHPHVTVEVGTAQFPVVASVASDSDRSPLYDKMVDMMPAFAEYRQRTSRVIPVILLRREDEAAS